MADQENPKCMTCGESHAPAMTAGSGFAECPAVRQAVTAGAQPRNVPMRIYNGYMDARAALRDNTPDVATSALQALLSQLAVDCGAHVEQSFANKMAKLCDEGVISPRLRNQTPENAWALMSVAEHAFYHLYIKRAPTP